MRNFSHFYKEENDLRTEKDRKNDDVDEMGDVRLLQRYGIARSDGTIDPHALLELINVCGAYMNVVFNNVGLMHTHNMSMSTLDAAVHGHGLQMTDIIESVNHLSNAMAALALTYNIRDACLRCIQEEEGVKPLENEEELDNLVNQLFQWRKSPNDSN